ncbi:MAG TPA: heme-binding protein [Methanomassiliicoccales archaeon]|nr:heme-binding protein [Methanomassiliicoccales archaeon]
MTEQVSYSILMEKDGLEIRQYPDLLLATVMGLNDDDAFRSLFRYISGANRAGTKIPMTAPSVVSSGRQGRRIEMTVPVVTGSSSMSFVLPEEFDLDSVPAPDDEKVSIELVPARKIGALRFRGYAGDAAVEKMRMKLLEMVKAAGFETVGEPFTMSYNGPFIPGFLRRNEVAVEVR